MNKKSIKELEAELENQSNRHSRWVYASFGMYQPTWSIIVTTQNLFLFFYYHAVIGLDPFLILLATAISTVWVSFNDPFIGFLVDRNFKFTRKWGRRFPWIAIGAVLWTLSFFMIFNAPEIEPTNPWPAFWWLLLSYIILDAFLSLCDINVSALRADKFRTDAERRIYSGYFGTFDMVALAIGMIVPPLLIGFGTGKTAYTNMALSVAIISLICVFFFLPGAREDKTIIDRYFTGDYERMSLLKGAKEVIKQKSFIALFIHYSTFGIATTIMTSMVVYLTIFVLRISADMMTIFFAIFLVGALISVPFWLRLLKKLNESKKVYVIGSFALCAALIPLTFFQTAIDFAIFMFIAGFAMGCIWTIWNGVIYNNVQDDYVVRTGRNQKGVLIGTWAVLGFAVLFMDELLISLVFNSTGFAAGYDTYEELVAVVNNVDEIIWGIRFLVGVIPMLVLLLGTLIFWKLYPLTQEKVLENKAKLEELGY